MLVLQYKSSFYLVYLECLISNGKPFLTTHQALKLEYRSATAHSVQVFLQQLSVSEGRLLNP
jgi:hypothetical protein